MMGRMSVRRRSSRAAVRPAGPAPMMMARLRIVPYRFRGWRDPSPTRQFCVKVFDRNHLSLDYMMGAGGRPTGLCDSDPRCALFSIASPGGSLRHALRDGAGGCRAKRAWTIGAIADATSRQKGGPQLSDVYGRRGRDHLHKKATKSPPKRSDSKVRLAGGRYTALMFEIVRL